MSLFLIAFRSIQQRGVASLLTMLSMALGVMLVVAVLAIEQGFVPATANTDAVDRACPVSVPLRTRVQAVRAVMVNALGFGGNNCSLVFGAVA